jgi:non-specific serine/threonine protein kinase
VLEGDLELAVRFFGEVGDNAVTHGERPITSDAWRELGHVHVELGMPRLARACFMKSVESAYGLGDAIRASRAFEGLARTIADEQPASAIRLCAAADRLRKAHCAAARPTDLRRLETWLAAAQHALGDRAFRSAWQAGRRMTIDEVLVFARSLSQPQDTASSNRGRLTSRERQVLSLLARGFSTYQIASELAIRNATARTHVERILSKLGVHSRTQAAAWANEHQYA